MITLSPGNVSYMYHYKDLNHPIDKIWVHYHHKGNSAVTGGFPVQRASNAENASIWGRHRE